MPKSEIFSNLVSQLHLRKRLFAKAIDLLFIQVIFDLLFSIIPQDYFLFNLVEVYLIYVFSFSFFFTPTIGKQLLNLRLAIPTQSFYSRFRGLFRELILLFSFPIIVFSLLFKSKILLHDYWTHTLVLSQDD